ncbi:MAG: hypothetical protein XD60_0364 [Acetothermia bacterium 64_32]|nr:MAG: hypothetical protein XD60_0364 [Acetothermia bacterium 64_32]
MRTGLILVALAVFPWVAAAQGMGGGLWVESLDIEGTKAALLGWAEGQDLPEETLGELGALLGGLPAVIPVPLFGVALGVPLGPVEFELEGALLTDGMLRSLGGWPAQGLELDLAFRACYLALGLSPRLDLGLIAVAGTCGLFLWAGDLSFQLATYGWKLTWRGIGGTLGARLELGLPFFRLFCSGALLFPWGQVQDAWGIRVGPWQGRVGVVIRF